MKKVLILNISYLELGMINALKGMGFYVIGTGNNPNLIGKGYVDEYIAEDFSNKEKILALSKQLEIDAICACGNDFGVLTAAYVAEKLGFKGHDTYENAIIMHHKDKWKTFAQKNNIKTPWAENFTDKSEALKYIQQATYPIIVKPVDLSAGRGISRADNVNDGEKAVENAFEQSRSKVIVIEPFIEGTLHAFCTFIKDKRVAVYCSNNEYTFVNPYRVEVATYPADHIDEIKDELIEEAEKMAEKLGLTDGILSMQYLYKDGKIYIIEAMRRVLGNMYMLAAERANNFNWNYWEARVHAGLGYENFPENTEQTGYYAYRTIMANHNGIIKDIVIPNDIKEHIFRSFNVKGIGDEIESYTAEPIMFLLLEFDSKEEMMNIMLDRYSEIYAVTE